MSQGNVESGAQSGARETPQPHTSIGFSWGRRRLSFPQAASCSSPPSWSWFAAGCGDRGSGQGCTRREGASQAAPAAVRQAVGGGCQSGWGRLLSVTNAVEAGAWRQGDSGWMWLCAAGDLRGDRPPPIALCLAGQGHEAVLCPSRPLWALLHHPHSPRALQRPRVAVPWLRASALRCAEGEGGHRSSAHGRCEGQPHHLREPVCRVVPVPWSRVRFARGALQTPPPPHSPAASPPNPAVGVLHPCSCGRMPPKALLGPVPSHTLPGTWVLREGVRCTCPRDLLGPHPVVSMRGNVSPVSPAVGAQW